MNKMYYVLLDAASVIGEIQDIGSYVIVDRKEIYVEGIACDGTSFELRLKLKKDQKEAENGD